MQQSIILMVAVIYFGATIQGLANELLEGSNPAAPELSKNKDITDATSCMSLHKKLKHFINHEKDLTNLTRINSLIWMMQQALVSLKGYQSKVYQKTTNCSMPLVPTNGGLVCALFDDNYYCKPMCNQGYDFSFLRRSRLYEICGRQTGFSWTSQYLGGNRLAECIASHIAISGQSSTYFKNKRCQEVLNTETEKTYIEEFINELKNNSITDKHNKELDILMCG